MLALVNWRKDKGHHSKTLSIGVACGLDKVTEGTVGMSFGLVSVCLRFLPILVRDPLTQSISAMILWVYVVKQLAVCSTPFPLKTAP